MPRPVEMPEKDVKMPGSVGITGNDIAGGNHHAFHPAECGSSRAIRIVWRTAGAILAGTSGASLPRKRWPGPIIAGTTPTQAAGTGFRTGARERPENGSSMHPKRVRAA